MKKTLIVLGCFALALASCGSPQSSATNEDTTTTDTSKTADTSKTTTTMTTGEKLIAKSDCVGCHNKTEKVIGPAYVDIAAKYSSNDKNIKTLSEHIIKGSKGVWGDLTMTPHADLSKGDAKEMVKYILTLRK